MKYTPLNDNILLKVENDENVTSSGIIIDDKNKTFYLVVETTTEYSNIKGMRVILNKEPLALKEGYAVIKAENIIAVENVD